MSESNHNTGSEHLQAENERLSRECEQNAQLVEMLRMELAETNQGVLALYAELDDQAQSLREATALKSRFLSYMSHEFRTPLGSIRSIVRILLDRMDGPLNMEQEKQLALIQNSAVELTEMVNDLLDLARIEAGRIAISPEWFEMVDLFSALRGMFKPLLNSSTVTLTLEEPSDLPRIYTDHKKLSQVLRNYISNALKFTTEGEIRVSAQRVENDGVTFSVSDTGIGIPHEHQGKIFQDFVQVDSPMQKKLLGTGLGLAISKKIAELLGGSVGMTSEPGSGSTFWVTIPICFGDPPEGLNAPSTITGSENSSNVE
ncbi:MAG: ATP-binding protein [Planctomycetales bacterium]